ncbi:hypothetical protein BDL97_05G086300 [Sphagnum fallax]|nr:hypothetical protein BDL97_05G086300 [Sphagnum fallax]KAH8962124.1 hypothetical protein BDL97_05G086300 [Sphagnum fallax]KAH8962125.1 hypothetical protein BDL97_05G086300 [Sphagnum fallax]KAH8962126.1 hypothetical protein BDL97_05G086300 [Sphagnum fallax]
MGLHPSPAFVSPLTDSPNQEILFEFRAGKMMTNGTRVTPDPRKGLVRLSKSEDTLTHFQWWDRTLNLMEDDQIIFPEEASFEKVGQSSGRVYLLSFKHDDRKFFFWMQETRQENDGDICNIVMHHLNRPLEDEEDEPEDSPKAVPQLSEGGVSDRLETSSDLSAGTAALSGEMSHGTSTGVVQLTDLQRILSGLGQAPEGDLGMARDTGPGFSELLKPDIVVPLLENLQLEERLAPYLPEGVRSNQAIAELMQSPQFHQQLDSFTQVIRSGQMDLSQFGIDPSKYNFTVAAFLEAIEEQANMDGSENGREQRPNHDVMEEGR